MPSPTTTRHAQSLTEYGAIMQDIAKTPRRSLLTGLRLMIAGQLMKPRSRSADQ